MSAECSPIRKRLSQRSQALQRARAFFLRKGLLETDCLALGKSASIDLHIDLFNVEIAPHDRRYLFSSPEYQMKRLIAEGSGDIFYLGRVFRKEEHGRLHAPEFTMAEWYRVGFSFEQMIDETVDFILDTLTTSEWSIEKKSYHELFQELCGINPHTISLSDLLTACRTIFSQKGIIFPSSLATTEDADDILHLMMSCLIEPALKRSKTIVVITHYPSSQAALAKTIKKDQYSVGERFEVYVEGVEIANGYHELSDMQEQRRRFEEDILGRAKLGKETYPIDQHFLSSLTSSQLPDCSGVAVGFDRLLMRAWNVDDIAKIFPLSWELI